jgi:hypothetical protein
VVNFENPFKRLSKTQLYITVGGAGLIAAYFVIHHHSTSGSWNPWSSGTAGTGTAATGTSIDPITGLAYSDDNATDPLTGQGYLAEAQQYGSVAAAEASVSAYGTSTATGSGIGVNPASPASTGTVNTVVGTSVYTSNAAWAQAATNGLVSVGYDGTQVATALGDYLTQTPVTPGQAQLINTAIAEYGPAPTGNLQIIAATGTPTGITSTTSSVSGGHVVSVSNTRATIAWTPTGTAKQWTVAINGPGYNNRVSTVTTPQASFSGLQSGHDYEVTVTPVPNGHSGVIDIHTTHNT